jgi:16S rRNA (cytosine967-C5)-methyltransferase
MPDTAPPNPRHQAVRWKHLCRLWRELASLPALPQLDRWLSQQLRREKRFGKRDRQWYSDQFFGAARFGYLALFCEAFAGKMLDERRGTPLHEDDVLAFVPQFAQAIGSTRDMQAAWASMHPARIFFWTRHRAQADVQAFQPLDDELPPEPAGGYAHLWGLISRVLARSPDTQHRLLWQGVPLSEQRRLEERAARAHWSPLVVEQFVKNHATRPPLWIRINHPASRPKVIDELQTRKFLINEHRTGAMNIVGRTGIYDLECHRSGLIEVQDLASQLIGASVGCKPGDFVWDCCAGSGGKTLQLAALLANRGAVYASDIRMHKLEELRERARRTGFTNIRVLPWQGETPPSFGKALDERGGFDWVLVDAPCSSSGTWRRNPDGKLRLNREELPSMAALQLRLLSNASQALRPGGALVYATCSWFVEEDELVVESFLRDNPLFSSVSSQILGNPAEDSDTMFAAVIRKAR